MESNQSAAIENPSDVQLKDEPTNPGSDAAVAYQSTGSDNPDVSMAAVAPYMSDQNPVNGNSGEIAGYQSAQVSENGALQNGVSNMTIDQQNQQYLEGVYSVEEERLWNMVRVNCLDFNSWTSLIDETERVAVTDIIKLRKVYDAFLAEFPLCFGYWKKYADHEARLDGVEKTVEVYERAVLAVTYSVEIWGNYCQFAISTYDDPDIVRRLFDRGLAYVGTDYRSDLLWDEYIRYEESQQAWSNLATIYTRILEHPIQQFDRYYNCFKELTASHPLSELRTSDEAAATASSTNLETGTDEKVLDGEAPHDSGNDPAKEALDSEELEKYVSIREEMYKKAKEYESKIIAFELGIRRPYFHVKPLDDPELDNWHNYLDFIEKEDDFNKVLKLYERCLIACANYPEYWKRYVNHMDATGSLELANNALARATQVFVKKQPEIHLFAARFKEQTGDLEGARAEYQLLYSDISPGLLEAIVRHANMEYRLGEKEVSFSVYQNAIAAEQEKEQSVILPMLLIQYSRFLHLVAGDVEKAREILGESLEKMPLSKHILEAMFHLESIGPLPKRIKYLDSLVEKFITPNPENPSAVASSSEREELSCIFLEFLDMFGDNELIKKASNRHMILFSRQRSVLLTRKRSADDSLLSDRGKVSKIEQTQVQAQSLVGTYSNPQAGATTQWPAAYAQKTPPQVAAPAPAPTAAPALNPVAAPAAPAAAPAAAWAPPYSAQAGYAAYGGYTAYGQVQAPQSTPQAGTAYGAYPTTYPQAYPPQTVVQPVAAPTAATSVPPQPATTTQQQYYGTYY